MKNREKREDLGQQKDAKARFLVVCMILGIVYIGFSFALHAFADPPGSPYTPGETLNPTCSPTSTNCTVEPPLFSTTTLPQGGILFVNDGSGTIAADTSTLYWNASATTFQVGSVPAQSTSTALLLLGPNSFAGNGINPSGTFIGINKAGTSTGPDFLNFEASSSVVFNVGPDGDLEIGTSTQAGGTALLTIGSSSNAFSVFSNGTVLDNANINASGTITQAGVPVLTTSSISIGGTQSSTFNLGFGLTISSTGTIGCNNCGTVTTSTANTLPIWTGTGTLGNSFITELTNANATSVIINFNTLGLPTQSASSAFLYLGANTLIGGNGSGTYLGANATSGFTNGDFLDFEVNSSTKFKVSATGTAFFAGTVSSTGITFTNASGSGNLFAGSVSSTGITFTNATGSGKFFATAVSSTGITFTNATGSGNFQVGGTSTFIGHMIIGTSSFITGTSTLQLCPLGGACTASSTASTTVTVLWVGSIGNGATGTSIITKGSIASGQADLGEYIPIVGDDSDYSQGEVLSAVESSSGVLFGPSETPYDPNLAGAVTVTAGIIAGGGTDHGSTVIALAGRIPVNVTTENGSIYTGDYITSSNIPGVGMLATQPGRVIGMALEDDVADPDNPDATSQVMMLVNPGWSLGNLTSTTAIASSSWALDGLNSNGQVVLDQFTAYVQAALAKLGLALANGVATLQQVIADTVTTNELCVQGTCINGSQLSNLLNNSSPAAVAPAPAPAPVLPPPSIVTPVTSTSADATSTSTPIVVPGANVTSTDVTSSAASSSPPSAPSDTSDASSSDSGGQ